MLDSFIHRILRVPYTLHVRHNRRSKRPRATYVFIHGLGNSSGAWDEVIHKLPDDVRVVTIDLLGFGQSPRPQWAVYDAKTQARSVIATLLKLRFSTPLTIVGHSLGALVAIEMALRYPLLVKKLFLCSPPLYDVPSRGLPRSDNLLRQLYSTAEKRQDHFLRLASFAMKYNLVNTSFNVTEHNISSYMAALNTMIINQTSLSDAHRLNVPTLIIRGTLDPFIVSKNLSRLSKENKNVTIKPIIAGHEIRGRYTKQLIEIITSDRQDKV